MQTVRLFVSSPGDVAAERQRVQWIADKLSGEFAQLVRFDTILWESSVYNAHEGGFQAQIEKRAKPADCDIVLAIFWSRLGTALPDDFPERMPDGQPYPSGSAYEVLSALEARRENKKRPDVFVFRKDVVPTIPINDKTARQEADRQWERLQDFFARYFVLPDKRILRVAENFRDLGELERKVELLLRDWIESNVLQVKIWPIEKKGSPFRGLEPFDAKHTAVYFGRMRKVLRALDELVSAARRGKPFLLIPGASGSGKSSLMRAGLAPRLVQPGTVADVDVWRTAVMRPATDGNPLLALARALFVTGDAKRDDPGGFGKALPELAQGAFKTPERLAQLFQSTDDIAVDPIIAALDEVGKAEAARRGFDSPLRANLLLLVDQLEDIFAQSMTDDDRDRFANLLAALVNKQRVWLIATLRGDTYENMITKPSFVALKDNCGQIDLDPPGRDELDEILHRSAEAAGLQYETRDVEDEAGNKHRERLDDLLLDEANRENTLPLLQFVLNLLFEKCWDRQGSKVLTFAAYEEIGGLVGSINQTAEIALARLVRPGDDIRFPLEKSIQEEIAETINPRLEALLLKLVGVDMKNKDASAERAPTVRIVPIGEATRDGLTGQIINALLEARILTVSHSEPRSTASRVIQAASPATPAIAAPRQESRSTLRLAHDRVITSWDRARVIVEMNRDFYRVKESIEQEQKIWEAHQRSDEFLIPAGVQISQAEDAVKRFRDAFDRETRDFVDISSRRARLRQRLMKMAAILFAAVAVIAAGASYFAFKEADLANKQTVKATENYEAARDTVRGLVSNIAAGLRDRGLPQKTIEEALNRVVHLVDNLEAQNRGDTELGRIRATMHFEFAKVFQNSRENNLDRALEEATKSLDIRTKLVELSGINREWLWDQASSFDQIGDIYRERAKNYLRRDPRHRGAAVEFEQSRDNFDRAYKIKLRLHNEDKDSLQWTFGLSQSLVRIGDHEDFPGRINASAKEKRAAAKADYQEALALIVKVIGRDPENENENSLHELGWCLKKVADILFAEGELPACLSTYEKALCTRRYLASIKPANTLYKRDVAFCLENIGRAKSKNKDFEGTKESLLESLQIREELIAQDSTQKLWMIEYTESLYQMTMCMLDAKELELAAGFFELANEKLPSIAEDVRAKRVTADLEKAKSKIGAVSPAPQQRLERKGKAAAMLHKMAAEPKATPSDLANAWNDLKDSLLETESATLAQQE
jgi:tetratricopeptide (TPR) repeat protein